MVGGPALAELRDDAVGPECCTGSQGHGEGDSTSGQVPGWWEMPIRGKAVCRTAFSGSATPNRSHPRTELGRTVYVWPIDGVVDTWEAARSSYGPPPAKTSLRIVVCA